MHFSLWQKYGSVNKVFKKLVSLLIGICLLLGTTAMAAKEEQPIPERFASVMEVCNATTAAEMHQHLIDYINATWADYYTTVSYTHLRAHET